MSTSNDDMPANLGLWDQNQALKWVKMNIKEFGGNPTKVKQQGISQALIFPYYEIESSSQSFCKRTMNTFL